MKVMILAPKTQNLDKLTGKSAEFQGKFLVSTVAIQGPDGLLN